MVLEKIWNRLIMLPSFVLCRNNVNFEVSCPSCILHTRTGCIPHLSKETLGFLDSSIYEKFFQIPLPSVISFVGSIEQGGGTNECFAFPPQSFSYLSIQDFSRPAVHGYNTKNSVAIWRSSGKVSVTSQLYMKAVEALQPDIYQILADCDLTLTDSRKRILKSMNRSLQFLEDCVNFHKLSKALKHSRFMCTIVGGHLVEERKEFVKLMKEKLDQLGVEPCGYVLDLLVEQNVCESVLSLVETTIDLLPPNKPVIVHGCGHPLAIIALVKCGVTLFDTAYITKLSESNLASVYKIPETSSAIKSKETVIYRNIVEDFVETVSLSDSVFAEDFSPLVEGCACYTCTHHTKAYLHHLVNVNEMLAPTLLMLHNLHHHFIFFKSLKELRANQLDRFQSRLIFLNSKEIIEVS